MADFVTSVRQSLCGATQQSIIDTAKPPVVVASAVANDLIYSTKSARRSNDNLGGQRSAYEALASRLGRIRIHISKYNQPNETIGRIQDASSFVPTTEPCSFFST